MNVDMARLEDVFLRAWSVFVFFGLASVLFLAIVLACRRFLRSTRNVPDVCQAAATIALVLGIYAVIGGIGHSGAVAFLAVSEPEYGRVQILRFTTGALLLYTGAMNIGLYRAIGAGRSWAIGVGVATNLLFWSHLLLALTLPGTGGTVPAPLGAWSVYLLWLIAAAFASWRRVEADGVPA